MRLHFALFALALLLAAPALHSAYTERLTVQVFDQDFRPVEGADVYAEYQLNSVTGYVKTKPHQTNISGYYDLQFTDYEQIESQVKYTYTLYVKYGEQVEQYSLVANPNRTRVYTSQVNAYYAFVRVHDQKGKPLQADLTVSGPSIADQKKRATPTGDAIFQLPPGSFALKSEYNGVVKNKDFVLQKDAALDVTFGQYTLEVTVTDDRKRPLIAEIEVGTRSVETGAGGTASIYNISDEMPTVVVRHASRYKTYTPNLALGEGLAAVFDLTQPEIQDLHATIADNGGATVTFYVEDAGASASGIDTVTVSYDVAGVETPIPAYAVGYATFEAKIPAQEAGSLVKYTVKIADKDGNSALGKGSYSVPAAPAPAPAPVPAPGPIPEIPQTAGGISTEMLFVLVPVAIAIVAGMIYYFRRKRQEGFEKGPQPPKIPSAPPASPP